MPLPRPARRATAIIHDLEAALIGIAQAQRTTATALRELAREQRITNLIVRSQISADPQEKSDLLDQARDLMAVPRQHLTGDPNDR